MIIKETLETKVTEICDILVCGGGFAGISAALAAARQGKKVILLEKEVLFMKFRFPPSFQRLLRI